MVKLKALRAAVGSYGRVATNGIIEIDESDAEKLLKAGRFQKATDADIKAAQKRQAEYVNRRTPGHLGFASMPKTSEASPKSEKSAAAPKKSEKSAEETAEK